MKQQRGRDEVKCSCTFWLSASQPCSFFPFSRTKPAAGMAWMEAQGSSLSVRDSPSARTDLGRAQPKSEGERRRPREAARPGLRRQALCSCALPRHLSISPCSSSQCPFLRFPFSSVLSPLLSPTRPKSPSRMAERASKRRTATSYGMLLPSALHSPPRTSGSFTALKCPFEAPRLTHTVCLLFPSG